MDGIRGQDLDLQTIGEADATAEVSALYERIRNRLRVSVVNMVWQVFATKPRFLEAVWSELEPAIDVGFMEAADGIRALAIERVREAASIPDHRPFLGDDLARAAEELRVFLEGNPRLLILTCALRRSWAEGQVGGWRKPVAAPTGVSPWHARVETAGRPSGALKKTFDDLTEILNLPEPNTDYRVLAKWPDYFVQAWADLRAFVVTDPWRRATETVDWVAEQAAIALPSTVRISPQRSTELGLDRQDIQEVGRWIEAFHGLLPGLIVNTSFLWVGMFGGTQELSAPPPPSAEESPPHR